MARYILLTLSKQKSQFDQIRPVSCTEFGLIVHLMMDFDEKSTAKFNILSTQVRLLYFARGSNAFENKLWNRCATTITSCSFITSHRDTSHSLDLLLQSPTLQSSPPAPPPPHTRDPKPKAEMLSPSALAQSASSTHRRSALAKLFALVRFLLTAKSTNAVRARCLLLLGATSATGFSVLLNYVARGFCRTPLEVAHLLLHVGATVVKTVAQYIARGFRPLYPNWTFSFEVLRAAMRTATELYGHRIADELHAKHIRRMSEVYGTSLGWFYAKIHKTRVEPVHAMGLEHVWIKSASSSSSEFVSPENRFVVLYYHGGGYAVLSPRMYIGFCNTLRTAIQQELQAKFKSSGTQAPPPQVDFFLANYRKIPEHPFPIPAEDAVAMYEHVVEHYNIPPERIIVAGDSAGGGLTMSTLLRLRDAKPHLMPLAAMLCCPSADLSEVDDFKPPPHCVLSMPMVDACRFKYHTTTSDRSTWLDASPVHCDLNGLAPVFLQTATLDYLYIHSQRLMEKAKADGVQNWEVDVQRDVPHVFTVFPTPLLPHAMVGIQNMARFAAKHIHEAVIARTTTKKKTSEENDEGLKTIDELKASGA